ncbi:MAG: dethiobiotin synthase [Flavobacteriales bacterium]|nr:dethiobiotin synthase [Flavobacteriales bacterium]
MNKGFFVTGIDTEIGKTVTSSVLVEALKSDYWKPIQSGDLEFSDTMKVKSLISNSKTFFHQEGYALKTPMSPHAAAKIDDVHIELENIVLPQTQNSLIVEGAGGLMVPINEEHTILDIMKKLKLPVIVVSKNYLGSINHTLLTVNCLRENNLDVKGVIFSGEENAESQRIILKQSQATFLGRIPFMEINKENILKESEQFKFLIDG